MAAGLEQFMEFVKQKGGKKNKDDVLKEAIHFITIYLLPCFTKTFLCQYVKKRCNDSKPNAIKVSNIKYVFFFSLGIKYKICYFYSSIISKKEEPLN